MPLKKNFLTERCVRSNWARTRIHQLSSEAPGQQHTATSETSSHDSHDDRNSKNGNTSESQYDRDIENSILAASLPFVHKNGWSKAAICDGAESLGYAGVVHGMFPRGGIELVNYFYTSCNEQLVEHLKVEADSRCDNDPMPDPDVIVKKAVEARLRMVVPYLDKWPEALMLMALPPNVPTSLANVLTLVDDICYYAGDRSVDVRWYSRRIALATIYKITELYLIQDKSADHKSTWEFLHRRVEEAVQLQRLLDESEGTSKIALETIAATFETARNILRLNR